MQCYHAYLNYIHISYHDVPGYSSPEVIFVGLKRKMCKFSSIVLHWVVTQHRQFSNHRIFLLYVILSPVEFISKLSSFLQDCCTLCGLVLRSDAIEKIFCTSNFCTR